MAETTFHSITLPGQNPARVPLTAVEFSTSTAYKVRDYCTYQGKLYICSTAHAAGAWNAAHFTEVNVGDEINTRLVVPPTTEPASTDRRVGDLWIDTNTESPVISIDPQPVAGSTNVPQSGGTFNLIKNLDNNKAGKSLLTGNFDATKPYSVNQLCIHDGYLYRCKVDIPTGTAWDGSKWQATTIETELARIESEEVDLDVIAETFGDSSSYAVGDYVLHTTNGVNKLYRCTNAVSDTSLWNSQYWSEVKLADEVSDLKSATNQLITEIGSPIYDMTEISLTTISGYAVTGTVGQTVSIAQSTYWKYAKFGCNGGDTFIVNTYMASNTAVTGYVYFTDTNDKILSVQVTPTGTQQYSGNTIVTAPTGSAYIYLKGYIYGNTASHAYDYTIRPLSNEIQNNTKGLVGYEFFLSPNGISFSGNGSQDTPLIVDFNGRLYYRNLGSTGDLTHSITTSSAFSIAHGQALVFDLSTNTLSVVNNANGVLGSNYRILLRKHVTTIGGYFAYEYYIATMGVATGFATKYKNVTIMSRQGEFFLSGTQNAAPYNCRIGIKNANQNGYSAIRISVRATSDHVWVLSHDGIINSVARNSDGTEITDPVYVADSTLAELNQYDYGIKYGTDYAGEDITTLDEALLLARKLSLYTCIEIYPTNDIGDNDIASLCKSVIDSGSVKSTEFRSPNVTTLQSIKTIIDGANFDLTFYASDGDSGVQNKITALKALSNGRNTIRMTTIPDTISNASFQTSIQRIIKEGIELELASTYGYAQLKTAIESGYCNIIESTNVINPYSRLNMDFV